MFEQLSGDVLRDDVKAVVSVCFGKGELDVGGLGDMPLAQTLAMLTVAQQFIMDLMRDHMESGSC